MKPETEAAYRVLHASLMEGRSARELPNDLATAGPALFGVANAFFRNIMERPFSGHESPEQVVAYLTNLVAAYPGELEGLDVEGMGAFVRDQIGPDSRPSGQTRFGSATVVERLWPACRRVAECVARREGIVGKEYGSFLQGAAARYESGS